MRFVDTNVFVRYLTNDVPEKADECERIFKKAVDRKDSLFITQMVVAEIVWVLESYYELPNEEVRDKVEKILNTPNLFCPQKDLMLAALSLYVDKDIDFIEAYNALVLKHEGIREVYSYDAHYDRIDWLERIEP
ncbi:MAG: PIN domain-containing protein [Deltaproteobacteria bacterium]|nr:PIN domain-containing protein [Deltaproteobacteria bacterium]